MLPLWWRANFVRAEFWLSVVAGLGFFVWVEKYGGDVMISTVLQGNRGAVHGTLASIFGSLLGFAITAVAIVLGFAPFERMAVVRESSHYERDSCAGFGHAVHVGGTGPR